MVLKKELRLVKDNHKPQLCPPCELSGGLRYICNVVTINIQFKIPEAGGSG